MLMQRPVDMQGFGTLRIPSESEAIYMVEMAANKFDQIIEILRILPIEVMLVIRNINTVRAITKDHGSLVDRYSLMARSATRGAFVSHDASFSSKLRGYWEQFRFDLNLRKEALKVWFLKRILYFFFFIGKGPDMRVLTNNL